MYVTMYITVGTEEATSPCEKPLHCKILQLTYLDSDKYVQLLGGSYIL